MKFQNLPCSKVAKSLIHKHRDDDIFLYNCRGALPAAFEIPVVKWALLDSTDATAIENCYVETTTNNNLDNKTFCLKGIPWEFDIENPYFVQLNNKAPNLLNKYYQRENDTYRLRDFMIPEIAQNEIQIIASSINFTEHDRYLASQALDKIKEISRPAVFHCVTYNDTKHYYFYGKRHEHVPGIMIMEIARQAFYAHFYRFNKHTRESVNLSILNFSCEFVDYIESAYPLLISVETLSLTPEGGSREKHHLRATFSQRGRTVSIIEMIGTVVGVKLFKKFRSIRPPASDIFSLICDDAKVSVLLRSEHGTYVEGWFSRISADTLFVKVAPTSESLEPNVGYKFHLFSEHSGIIIGDGIFDPQDQRAQSGEVSIRISNWAKGSECKVREFIKMDCFLNEQLCTTAE